LILQEELKKLRNEFPRPFAEYNAGGEMERTGYSEDRIEEWLKKFDALIESLASKGERIR